MKVLAIVGTLKGAFLFRSDESRSNWEVEGPIFKGWKVTAVARDAAGNTLFGTASDIYGTAIQRSRDLSNWVQIEEGPSYPKDGERKLNQIWTLCPAGDRVYAGVDEAGLFQSDDGGDHWKPVEGLNEHPTRSAWYPGAGGLCAHSILVDPKNSDRLWCGISAVGVFRSDDGGLSWTPKNEGVTVIIEDKTHKDIGYCVHSIEADPDDADRIYRQDHRGMYRTANGGDTWEKIENGLPSGFGFPLGVDRKKGHMFTVPLESDEFRMPIDGKLTVYRSRDQGESWEPMTRGLPQENAYMGVLRGAMATDDLDPCGVYMGTTAGSVHFSADGGDSWSTLPVTLPRVLSVDVFVDE